MSKYVEKINQAYKDGILNEYMVKRLLAAVENGMTDGLSDELIQDAQCASDAGVKDDNGYNIYFFTGRFADDILDDTFGMKVPQDRKKDLLHYIMSHTSDGDYKFDNLIMEVSELKNPFGSYRLKVYQSPASQVGSFETEEQYNEFKLNLNEDVEIEFCSVSRFVDGEIKVEMLIDNGPEVDSQGFTIEDR